MRRSILIVTAAVGLMSATALAAPTCQDAMGVTVRCGTPGAMPVGWTLPQELRPASRPIEPHQLLEVLCALGGFFALLALMPDFEGDWDEEGSDEED